MDFANQDGGEFGVPAFKMFCLSFALGVREGDKSFLLKGLKDCGYLKEFC